MARRRLHRTLPGHAPIRVPVGPRPRLGCRRLRRDDGGEGADSAYCKQLKKTAKEATAQTHDDVGQGPGGGAQGQQKKFNKSVDKIVDKAPKELEDDYKAFKEYVALRFD